MLRWSCVAVAVVAAGPAAQPEAARAIVVSSVLRGACEERNQDDAVLACDPLGPPRQATLTLGAQRTRPRTPPRGDRRPGTFLRIGGDEPLDAGETVTLDWVRPSTQAELAVKAFTPYGVRTVVVRLTWRPRHVAVTAGTDGALEIRTPGRKDVVAPPSPPAPEQSFWTGGSALKAADRVLWVIDHLADRGRRTAVLKTLCAGLHPDIYPFYGFALQRRGIERSTDGPRSCLEEMWLHLNSQDAKVQSSEHHGRAIAIRGRRAVLRTRIVQRYDTDVYFPGTVPARAEIKARILLMRDAEGIWRLASFRAIAPDSFIESKLYPRGGPETYDDRALEDWYLHQRRWSARHQAAYDREEAERRAALARATSAPPCSPPWRADPAGDVIAGAMNARRTRRPDRHLDVDLTAAGFDGQCLGVRTADPLPTTFDIRLGIGDEEAGDPGPYHLEVDREAGTVIVSKGTFDEETVRGVAVALAEREAIVRLPQPLSLESGPPWLGVGDDLLGITYWDDLDHP